MSRGKVCPLTQALLAMLPGAKLISRQERAWHSATFSGSRIEINLVVPTEVDAAYLAAFRDQLPEHDFALKQGCVADIAIKAETPLSDGGIEYAIEALMLDA